MPRIDKLSSSSPDAIFTRVIFRAGLETALAVLAGSALGCIISSNRLPSGGISTLTIGMFCAAFMAAQWLVDRHAIEKKNDFLIDKFKALGFVSGVLVIVFNLFN